MSRMARAAVVLTAMFLLGSGYCLFNLRHLSRVMGYDEVYYLHWVDDWDNYEFYYPHHLLFAPSSVLFQRAFTELTGITNTAFIQKFKNVLLVSIGLSLFFLFFYLHSKRFWLSVSVALLIGISGSLWHDVHHHETAAIPGVLINLNMMSLWFYRKFPYPPLFILLFAFFNALAILLHQAYLFSIAVVFLILLFTRPEKDSRFSLLRNAFRSALYGLLVLVLVGGTYFYIGFGKLGLRLQDNPQGTQSLPFFTSIPVRGNFIRYFYLIKAREKWGMIHSNTLEQGIKGYGASFVTTFSPKKVDLAHFSEAGHLPSNLVAVMLAAFLSGFLLFFVPAFRRYGVLYPGLLLWLGIGSAFIFWWEPWYIEHWIYITILTWVLVFMVADTLIGRVKRPVLRTGAYTCVCVLLLSVASVLYLQNFTHSILPRQKPSYPASVQAAIWREEYWMHEMYRQPSD